MRESDFIGSQPWLRRAREPIPCEAFPLGDGRSMNSDDLRTILTSDGIDPRWYHLGPGAPPDDTTVLESSGGQWVVYHWERGSRHDVRRHAEEDSACRDLLERMQRA